MVFFVSSTHACTVEVRILDKSAIQKRARTHRLVVLQGSDIIILFCTRTNSLCTRTVLLSCCSVYSTVLLRSSSTFENAPSCLTVTTKMRLRVEVPAASKLQSTRNRKMSLRSKLIWWWRCCERRNNWRLRTAENFFVWRVIPHPEDYPPPMTL